MAREHTHVYAIVRKDIPLADQLVQVAHATMEAGASFYRPEGGQRIRENFGGALVGLARLAPEVSSLVVLQVADKFELIAAAKKLTDANIRFELFFEPDDQMGHTALATEPLSGEAREVFRPFKLWKPV